jgi:tetratricopeptide (TPR) repeat protein
LTQAGGHTTLPPAGAEHATIDRTVADAIAAFRAGRLAEAEVLCRRNLKEQPDHVVSLQLLAAVAGQSGAPRRGIELVQRIIELQPRRADGHIQLAKLLRLEGRISDAVAALNKAIDLQPESAAAYNDLGLIHLAESDDAEAISCFERAIEISPELAIAHFNKGLAFERQGLRSEAAAAFRRAIAIAPDFAEAHAKLGNVLLIEDNRTEAFDCFRRAIAAKPDSVLALMCQAKLLVEDQKPAAAEELVRRAIERDPQNSDAHCLLGSILMELGRFDDAAAAYDLGISLNRRQTTAYHELVHARKLTEADRPLIAQMEWMLKEFDLADEGRTDLHFALGKAYDDLGEYGKAIRHFDAGNGLKRQKYSSYLTANHALGVDRQIATFTAEFLARNAPLGSDSELPVLILGMPRSGTTLVEQILSSHPEVAAGGELGFWGECASGFRMDAEGHIDPDWVNSVIRNYLAMLTGISPTARRVTDKRPQNSHYVALIHTVFPRARIIHCRRHPVDTCLSIYFQNFARRIDFAYDRGDLLAFYRQYLRLMAHWRSVLPADRFLEVQYEELVAERERLIHKIIEFCGLDWDDACLYSERNRRPVRTASVWQARQPVYQTSVARWRHYEPWLGCLRELLPELDR